MPFILCGMICCCLPCIISILGVHEDMSGGFQEGVAKKNGCIQTGRIIDLIDADKNVTLEEVEVKENADVQGRPEESQAQIYKIDLEHADKVLSMQDDESEPTELKEVVEVVTTAKLMTKVVTIAAAIITDATTPITAATITVAPSAARRRKGVVIRDPEETEQVQRKEKEDNDVLRYQALKRRPQTEAQARKNIMIYLRNMAGFKMDYFKGMSYDDIRPIFENSEEKASKKQKLDEEVEELKKHLQIVPNDDDDVYTEATPLALKVPVVDYAIHTENNKLYYKIIKVDGSHQLFLSLFSLLKNFDREDLEPDVEAQVWKNQRGVYGLAKVKSWRLLESCGVHIITFTTTQMILLVERRYPLTRFTLDQMLNNVRLEVKEESEVSLELLRFVRQQQQEGYRPE
uniref:E3 ubiquitin-protein ligase At1g63170-like n=1 Tax=Tanacetum cinerariifolium TaxID=118510 RepID=A0A6L2NMX2_TANCI|nr:E3 ubiquitin-protein ligase At1g63170-like [Tanacetum cinerariifolium]